MIRPVAAVRSRSGPRRARFAGMLPGGLWGREWLIALGSRRAVALKVAMPLVLTVPLAAGHAPTFWAGMLLSVLVAMIGAVGTGITVARARAAGLLARLAVVPRAPARTVGEWVVAAAAVDGLLLAPAIAVVLIAGQPDPLAGLALVLMVVAVLLVANVLGCALAVLAGSAGDVLLDVVVVLAPLLYLGGLFTGVPREGWRWWAARLDPFSYLHAAFVAALGGSPSFAAVAVLAAAAATSAAALLALAMLGRAVLERA